MKKVLSVLCLSIMFFVVQAIAKDYIIPSAVKTSSAAIISTAGYIHGISVTTDGTNAVTVNLYDNTAGSGTKIFPTWTVAATPTSQAYSFYPPVRVTNGLYASLATSGTVSYVVYYSF